MMSGGTPTTWLTVANTATPVYRQRGDGPLEPVWSHLAHTRSNVHDLRTVDLDGDGTLEHVAVLRGWGAQDIRVLDDAGGIVSRYRMAPGRIALARTPDGPRLMAVGQAAGTLPPVAGVQKVGDHALVELAVAQGVVDLQESVRGDGAVGAAGIHDASVLAVRERVRDQLVLGLVLQDDLNTVPWLHGLSDQNRAAEQLS